MQLVYFLGRFHVLALHLPIGILLIALAMEWAGRRPRYANLKAAAPFVWGSLALTAVVTVALGYMHYAEGGFTGWSASAHRALGTGVALLSIVTILARSRWPEWFARALPVSTTVWLILITLTGHYGGNLTHGPDFLFEYAPGPLRALAGHEAKRPAVTTVADADPFLDVVHPMLIKRCANCHNKDKHSGGFNVATLDSILKGGENGAVLVKGRSSESDLYRRITLPATEKDHMPAEGKTPLTADQAAIIKWWIDAGLPSATKVGVLQADPATASLIATELSLGTPESPGAPPATAPGSPLPQPSEAMEKLSLVGFVARPVSLLDGDLQLSLASPGKKLTDSQRAALLENAQVIVGLDLARAKLTDADVKGLEALIRLKTLRLENNDLSTQGLEFISGFEELGYLNIYGNRRVDDGIVGLVAKLPLKRLYLWGTSVTPGAVQRLKRSQPELTIDLGDGEGWASTALESPKNAR